MKPELSEQFFIEELFNQSIDGNAIEASELESIDKLTGDASTRRYYRVFTNKDSYVVCLDNPTKTGEKNTFVSKQSFLMQKGVRVPIVYDTNEARGYILEEDLGDITLLNKLATIHNVQQEYDLYKRSIDKLLALHKMEVKDIEQSKLFDLKFDYEKLISEIDFSIKYFINIVLKQDTGDCQKIIRKEFEPICQRLANEKMVLTHRDYHSRNIMCKTDDLIIIDFQDARMGIPQYDLASLLDDCYYEVRPENKDKLVKYYYENLGESILQQKDYDNFLSLYDDMVLQRVFKAIGSFAYILETRKDLRYYKYIGFAMEKIRNIMLVNPKYAELREALFKVYYES
jgi:aminoglycoside/choline kinase family phosphotransferase